MRICIFGAGAIGGFIGARLALAGHEPALIARGAHLRAIRANGLRIISGDEEHVSHPNCSDDPADFGPQDVVILTCKAHAVADVAERMAPLLTDGTAVVTTQNGLPWWYFEGVLGPNAGRRLASVDPGGRIRRAIEIRRVIGGVVVAIASNMPEPGVIQQRGTGAIVLGEIDGAESARCRDLAAILEDVGVKASVTSEIRGEIWTKVWGNASFSAIAVLTGSTLSALFDDPAMVAHASAIMEEARAVGAALGASFPITIAQRIEAGRRMGGHKTSMLQDLEAGRPMEVDAIVGSVIEAGRIAGCATPRTDEIYALVRRRAIEAGCYPENTEFAII